MSYKAYLGGSEASVYLGGSPPYGGCNLCGWYQALVKGTRAMDTDWIDALNRSLFVVVVLR